MSAARHVPVGWSGTKRGRDVGFTPSAAGAATHICQRRGDDDAGRVGVHPLRDELTSRGRWSPR
jgi:hypothetical protein